MADLLGFYNTSSTRTHVRFQFSTHAQAGGNVAPSSAIDAADIRIYRAADGAAFSATQRSSANGITVTSPFDSLTGYHDVDIDLTDNTDAGFYASGYLYAVVLAPNDETIDSQTITGFALAYFEIGTQPVNVTHGAGTAWNSGAIGASTLASDAITAAKIADGAIDSNTFAAGAITANAIAADAIGASELAADAVTEIRDAITGGAYALSTDANGRVRIVDGTGTGEIDSASGRVQITEAQIDQIVDETWDEDATGHQTQGSFGQAIGDPGSDSETIWALVNTNLDATISSRLASNTTGSGFSAIPWNASWDAEVQSEVQDAIEVNQLDHLIQVADPGSIVANSSLWAKLHSKSATPAYSSYDNTTDSLEAAVDAILARLPASLVSGRMDASVGAMAANTMTASATAADFVAEIQAAITGGAYDLDTDANGRIRIVDGTGAGELDTSSGAVILTSSERDSIAAAYLDLTDGIESGITPRKAIRACAAVLAGILSGAGTGTEVVKGIGQSSGGTTRVTATVDSSGNRSAMTLNL